MTWNLDDSRPIWPQLKEKLMRDIVAGRYAPGDSFPTVRDLAEQARVNRNTMQRALSELENEGLVITNRTAGRTVTTDEELIKITRVTLAREQIKTMLSEMQQLGFSADEVAELIRNEGGKKVDRNED